MLPEKLRTDVRVAALDPSGCSSHVSSLGYR